MTGITNYLVASDLGVRLYPNLWGFNPMQDIRLYHGCTKLYHGYTPLGSDRRIGPAQRDAARPLHLQDAPGTRGAGKSLN